MIDEPIDFSTPMMQQYLHLKAQYADCILWFRLGDFYEMFLEDAKIGAHVLDITLTSRTRGKDGRIPMAGVPYHAADNYLYKLIRAGYKVAICEQMTEPDSKKGLVEREVVRIVTPSTVLDEKNLTKKNHNYLMSLHQEKKELGITLLDVSTGSLLAGTVILTAYRTLDQVLADLITQYSPSECILEPAENEKGSIKTVLQKYPSVHIFPYQDWAIWEKNARSKKQLFAELAIKQELQHLELPSKITTVTALSYVHHTQKHPLSHLSQIRSLFSDQFQHLDRSTIANLELLSSLGNGQQGCSFLELLDYTITSMGGRLLKDWLTHPLLEKKAIETRQEIIAQLVADQTYRTLLRDRLSAVADLERLLARMSLRTNNPKDVRSLANSLQQIISITKSLETHPLLGISDQLAPLLPQNQKVISLIETTLVDDPPFDPRQGGIIRDGLHPQLDQQRKIIRSSQAWIQQLEITERQRTGISSLKIKYNQVFGFSIEVSKANLTNIPDNYLRKQTLISAERFVTQELKEQEEIILKAEAEVNDVEYQLFLELVSQILTFLPDLQKTAHLIAQLDCYLSFAELAQQHHYVRPKITDQGPVAIIGGRHPMVEKYLQDQPFIANDVTIDSQGQHLLIITGPNMAGKSVLMRQTALIVLLAHLGSFVPATSANISLVDQIFVRSGASDMISAGLSTFMVEMVETAYILKHATAKSLIIMDEIGRGTSTYDGISIAWAIAEFLANHSASGTKTLFATHYHELQSLASEYPDRIQNYHMTITEHEGKPVFQYQLAPGGASHSFGVAVAELAGLPESVISNARNMLENLEHRTTLEPHEFTEATHVSDVSQEQLHPLINELKKISIEDTTPLQALTLLASWKKIV